MARNLFGPMGVFSTPNDANQAQTAPLQSGQSAKPDVGTVAQKYRIPRNILMAFEERGEDPEEAARKIAAELDAGKAFQDIVPKAVRIRASDIADAIEGVQPEGGFGKAIGVSIDTIQQSLGSAVEGLGRSTGIEGLQTYGARVAEDNAAEAASGARGLTGLGDIDGIGSAASYVSELAGQQAPQMGVSLAGAGAGALAGSAFGPVGTVVGGVAGGLASSIPLFYGQNRERQKEAMAAEGVPVQVDEGAAFLTSLPQAGLDTFSNLLAASGVGIGAKVLAQGGGVLTKRVMLQAAGEGAKRGVIAEVPTEIGQAVLERAQAGLPLFSEDAIKEYIDNGVAAGILGGGLGAGGGVMDVRSEANKLAPVVPAETPAAPADPLLLPSPADPLLLPSPTNGGTIFGQPPVNMNPGADGSGVGQGAAPGMAPPSATGAAPVEPMGVLGRAAQAAPDLTPQPQAAPLFPDMKPGAKVVLADPGTGELIDATFQREENGIPIVRINGVEQPIPPQMFDMAVNAGQKAVEAAKGAKSGLAKAATPKALRPAAPEPDLNALSLEEAQARLTDLDEKIRIAAKPSKKMIETRARLIDVVDRKQGEANAAVQPDGGAGVEPVAPVQGGDTAGSGPDPVASVQGQGLPAAPASSGAESVADAAAQPQQGEALTQGARSTARYVANTEDNGDLEVQITRLPDGSATVFTDTATQSYPADFAASKTDEDLMAYQLEPVGYQSSRPASQAVAPRAPVAPITTPPAERIQPDMLGGQAVTEEDMATKERRKREWGKFLAIAEGGKYEDDMEIEGRDVLIRPGRVVIRAKKGEKSDLDYRLDTAGMARDDIATAMRGALRELDRVSPLPAAEPRPAAPALAPQEEAYAATPENFPFADSMAGNPGPQAKRWLAAASDETILATPDRGLSENWLRAERQRRKIGEWAEKQTEQQAVSPTEQQATEYTGATVEDIRERAAVLRGLPKDRPPTVPNVSLKWDESVGGFIFARKHKDAVLQAAYVEEDKIAAEKAAVPTASQIATAAAETDPNPTPAQAEAENYKTGKVEWNGLTLSIENAKGSTRRKVGPDGETAWEVVMPAHYGRILGTKGADGDHVDFYMGDNPDSDMVWIIDQMDAETGLFDEHKAMLGFTDAMDVSEIYEAGFSDGKGKQRLGGIRKKTVAEFKAWLDSGILKEPITPKARKMDSDARAKAEDAAPDPEFGPEGNPNKLVIKSLQTGKTREVDVGPVPVADDRREARKRQVRANGKQAALENMPRTAPDWLKGDEELVDLWMAGYGDGIAERAETPAKPAEQPAKPATGILSVLSEDKQKRADELKARLAAKARNQVSSGVDPEYLTLGGELVALYVEAGVKKFGQMLRDFAESTGLTMRQAQAPMRVAYNHVRDEMDLNGEDVSEFDTADQVMAEIRKAIAEEAAAGEVPASQEAPQDGNVAAPANTENTDAGPAIRRDDQEPLEGTPSEAVPPTESGRQAGSRGAGAEQEGGRTGRKPSGAESGDAAPRGGRVRSGRNLSGTGRVNRGKRGAAATDVADDTAELQIVKDAKVSVPAVNFTITDEVRLGLGSEGQKYADNIAAIRLVKQLEAENRRATPEEQKVLARYVGWGGMKNAFRVAGSGENGGIAKGYEKKVAELEELLDPAELKAARNSTKAAHYTSQSVVEAIWKAVQRLGFNGGTVLEPSVGVGNFLGLMPQQLRAKSRVMGVEYDSLTARIAKHLYPASDIMHSGFEKVPLPREQFALAIGNPPFGRDELYFQHVPEANGRTIHNQFFVASLHALAPEGILGMVVTHNLMDSLSSANRVAMARHGDLIGAIRLPSNAFQENARTEVVTDILFFRKHPAGTNPAVPQLAADLALAMQNDPGARIPTKAAAELTDGELAAAEAMARSFLRWLPSDTITDPAGSGAEINVNRYFQRNRSMIIGDLNATGTMHGRGNGLNVTMQDATQFDALLDQAIERLPASDPVDSVAERSRQNYDAMVEAIRLSIRRAEPGEVRVDPDNSLRMVVDVDSDRADSMLAEITLTEDTPFSGGYTYNADGKWQIERDVLDEKGKPVKIRKADGTLSSRNAKTIEVVEDLSVISGQSKWGKKRLQLLRDMLPIRDAMKRQLVLEAEGATDTQIADNRKALNDAYDAFVAKHGTFDKQATAIANMMPDGALILETQLVNKDTGAVSKSPIMSERVIEPPQAIDTAANIDDAIAISLSEYGGVDLDRMAALLKTDVADIARQLEASDPPKAFFDPETQSWDTPDGYLSGMVRKKLHAAQAAGLDRNVKALEAVLPPKWDSTQVTPTVGSNWIPTRVYSDFLQTLGYDRAVVMYSELTNTYSVTAQGNEALRWRSDDAMSADDILERLLNSKPIKVTRTDRDGKTYVDEVATEASKQKATEITAEFLDWVYQDDARREVLVDIFNEKFNTRVLRQRDGSHLKLPGKNPAIKMRRHQMNAIWRGITDRTVLLDHVVGAGKTFTAIARIMERRRMGLSRKPMVVVPNHLIEQWRDDTLKLYPGAKVLAAGSKDFERKNRRRLFARIAASDADMVIIGHSSFGFIDIDPATEQRFLEDELRRAQEAVREAEEEAEEQGLGGGRRKPMNVAEAERLVTKIEERLNKVRAGRRDRLLTFEQMGVDDLTIDEAHEFKNLAYSSRMTNTSGMGNKAGSAKAMDLHLKLRSLHERQGTSIAFLTGTPISNSVAEMYLLLRNLAPKELAELGLENFDAWRALFVSASAAFEPTEAGGVKEVTRLGREWTNMRSLMELYYSVADAVSLDDIKAAFAEDNAGAPFPVPPVKSQKAGDGDRQMIAVKPDQQQRAILREIVRGFESLPGISDPYERGAERLRLMDRARKVSLDARAVDPNISVPPGTGKIGAVVENVKRIYDASSADKGTQIIFLDRSVPRAKGDEEYVAKFDEWMQKLTEARNEGDEKAEQKAVEELEKFDLQDVEARRAAVRGGWNAYDEIKRQLVAKGVPEDEIRFVQEANNDEEKKALFAAVRRGDVRVLIGSTPRMGAGTNVQDLLVALHHADVTWKPSDIEQREGRIVRQGNKLLEKYGHDKFEVEVIAYATEMTVDAKMWSLNATKLKAINGVRKYDGSFFMEFEDEESASMAEMAALATGNPLMVERVTLEADRQRMDLQRRSFNQRQSGFRSRLSDARRTIANTDGEVAQLESYVAALEPALEAVKKRAAKRSIKIAGKEYKDPEAALLAAQEEIERQRDGKENARYKIDIDGNTVTTMDLINGSIKRAFGTPDFEAEVNGRPIIDIWDASQSISSAIGTAVAKDRQAESHFIDGITFMGMPVEIDVYQGQFDRGESRTVDINMVHEGQTVTFHQLRSDKAAISANALRPALESLAQRLRPEVFGNLIRHKKARKAQAEADLPMLEEEVGKAWPRQEEYDTKSARLREVIEILSTASDTARLGDDTETEADDSMEMRADREPVATLTGDELGAWEDIAQLGKKAGAWYRRNLAGTTVVNADSGMEVKFTNAGAKKVSGRKGDVLYRIVPALREIIERGVVTSVSPETKGRDQIKAWHAISATVMMGGVPRDVVAHVMETQDGQFLYDLSRDMSDGARFMRDGADTSITDSRYGVEDNPVALNLEFAPSSRKVDPEVQEEDLRALTKALNGMPEMRGLEGRVTVKAVRRLVSHVTGNDILGRFTARDGIEVRAGRGAIGVMRHEIIHALRSEKLWNAPYGLFSGPEWRELVRAARAEPEIVRSVMARYKDQPPALQAEEMVAELYRLWAAQRDQYGPVAKSLLKIEGFLRALANALRGRGFVDAGRTMDRIASGRIGGRGPDGSGGGRSRGPDRSTESMEMRALPGTVRDKFAPLVGFRNWRNPSEWISNFLTDRMVSENASILAVVPGRPLFSELGKSLLSAKAYLRTKEDMDALRNDWHAATADVADEWTRMQSKDPRANDAMMDLMHRSTMTGVDPSKPDDWGKNDNLLRSAKIEVSRLGDRAPDWAKQKLSDEMKRRRTYATVKQMYDALPPEYRAFYVKVKNTYEALANDWDKALEENLKNAARIAMKNAERAHRQALRKIKDDGLTGAERDEAVAKADEDLKKAKSRAQASSEGQIKSLRKIFEGQRLKGPYFPLARFGKYFVTVRNDKGEVVSFSRMETEGRQRTHIAEMKEKYPTGKVTFGTIDAKTNMRDQVDPKFVAEVEAIVADSGADADVLDAIWQRYLETLPDESIRTSKIHRKGREGFNRDALRAFAHHMFHGAHQLARLKYGLSLQEHVDDAREEARRSSNPNRMGALVDEMQRRMEWTMNPQGAAWVAAASSLSFVWYLGVSPAAALVNLSQTTIIGPAMMKARFQKVSTGKILSELARAAKDFGKGQGNVWTDTWSAENAETLTTEEKAAMAEGYRRGTIDKTQAYDLASVAESGVEYNPFREKWMRRIGWAFHHAERVNREVTYLANYRLARADGLSHADAMDAASDLTWQVHFSYSNSDRARIMQRDWPKFFLQFRQFSVNMLYRLFRDAHQSLNGATAAERREARTHLIGISLSMMAHAGIKGVWGYGLIMGLLALFFPGDSDELEDWMQDALLMEGDNPGVAAWNFAMGAALNGIPGQVTGASLVDRIGMPNLWFREPNRDLEGTDLLQHYVNETLGPTVGIMFSLARGAQYVSDGEVVRGVEAMTPKFVRDVIKTGRFAAEGVQTMNDDAILESVNPWELLLQANGFTPARVAERYDMNNRLKNREKEILDERKAIHRAAGDAIKAGGPIPEKVLADIRDFNARFPEYPITGDTIRQSFQGRMRASERNEFGVSLNPKLNDRLREALPAPVYN